MAAIAAAFARAVVFFPLFLCFPPRCKKKGKGHRLHIRLLSRLVHFVWEKAFIMKWPRSHHIVRVVYHLRNSIPIRSSIISNGEYVGVRSSISEPNEFGPVEAFKDFVKREIEIV